MKLRKKQVLFITSLLLLILSFNVVMASDSEITKYRILDYSNGGFSKPMFLEMDSDQNLYVVDYSGGTLKKINKDGTVKHIAGKRGYDYSGDNGPATEATFRSLRAMAKDSKGNIYLADSENHVIRKIDTSGIITTIAGTGKRGYSEDGVKAKDAVFDNIYGMAIDASDTIYFADTYKQRVRKIDEDGKIVTVAGTGESGYSGDGGQATKAMLSYPSGISFDKEGNLYISEQYNYTIRKVDTKGIITTIAGTGEDGYSKEGNYSKDGELAINSKISSPSEPKFDSKGNIYFSEIGNHVVRKIDKNGILTTIAGNGKRGNLQDDVLATNSTLSYPRGVEVDSNDNIYVCNGNRVQKLIPYVKSNNANLKDIMRQTGNLSPNFSKNTTEYKMEVSNFTRSIRLGAYVEDKKSTLVIEANGKVVTNESGRLGNYFDLKEGSNDVKITVTAEDGTKKVYSFNVYRKSNNANLSSLSLSEGTLSPVFSKEITNYETSVVNSITETIVTPVLEDSKSKVTVNGQEVSEETGGSIKVALVEGLNEIKVVATAEDGTKKTYTVVVNRQSKNANLSSLSLSEGTLSPVFSKEITNYGASVVNSITETIVTPVLEDSKSKVTVNGQEVSEETGESIKVTLVEGLNEIKVVVTAEDKTTKTYTVVVNRQSKNANLSSLSLSEGTLSPVFSKEITNYKTSVVNKITETIVTPEIEDSKGRVTVNGQEISEETGESVKVALTEGLNEIKVIVTAEDKTKKTYTVVVNRQSKNVELSDIKLTDKISLNETFESGINNYTATVTESVYEIGVIPTAVNSASEIKVNGKVVINKTASEKMPLKIGENKIQIQVTSEDKTATNTYVINVNRQSANTNLTNLVLSDGVLSPVFSSLKTNYGATVVESVYEISLTPTLQDLKATVRVNGEMVSSGKESSKIALNKGDNQINVVVTSEDKMSTKTYKVNVNRQSANAKLSNIEISDGVLSPVFSSLKTNYDVTVVESVYEIAVTPTLEDLKSTMMINGEPGLSGKTKVIALKKGENQIPVQVTSEDGTKRTYKLNVYRQSANANLNNLLLSDGSLDPVFETEKTAYNTAVKNSVDKIKITPFVEDTKATVKVNGEVIESGSESKEIELKNGNNEVIIEVVSEDKTAKKTYKVVINRQSANANLSGLLLSRGTLKPKFSSEVTDYNVVVSSYTYEIKLTPQVEDTKSKISINGKEVASGTESEVISLKTGDNEINIVVTSEDGTQKTYKVVVERQRRVSEDRDEEKSDLIDVDGNIEVDKTNKRPSAEINLVKDRDGKAPITLKTVDRMKEIDKTIVVENTGIKVGFKPNSIRADKIKSELEAELSKELDYENIDLIVGAEEVTGSRRDEILKLSKTPEKTNKIQEVVGKVFDLTAKVVKEKNGVKTEEKIQSFDEPVEVVLDLKDLNLTEKDIENLTAVRYEKGENGELKVVRLGGRYNVETKEFKFYTDTFELCSVAKVDEMLEINLGINKIDAEVNRKPKQNDVAPQIINNRTMVPVRFIAENMGADVSWNEEKREVTITLEGKTLKMVIDEKMEGFDTPPMIVDSRTLVPIRYVSEKFGAYVMYFPAERKVNITK